MNNTIHRVNAYIRNGWDKEIVDPDNQVKPASTIPQLAVPADGWQELSEVYGSAIKSLASQMPNYM